MTSSQPRSLGCLVGAHLAAVPIVAVLALAGAPLTGNDTLRLSVGDEPLVRRGNISIFLPCSQRRRGTTCCQVDTSQPSEL
jgi:hypothetical protein